MISLVLIFPSKHRFDAAIFGHALPTAPTPRVSQTSADAMGAANRHEITSRPCAFTTLSTVVSSLPNLSAGVKNYVHHVRFPTRHLGGLDASPTLRTRCSGVCLDDVDMCEVLN